MNKEVIYPTMVIRTQQELIKAQEEEIERLNNIINELEKWLETKREEYATNIEWLSTTRMSNVLDKLKALKENNK